MTTSTIRKSNERNSIILVGIILGVVLLVFSFVLIPFSLKDSLFEYGEAIKNDDIDVSTLGELSMLYYLIVGMGAFVLYAYGYGMAVSIIIASIVLLILSLKNRKMENKKKKYSLFFKKHLNISIFLILLITHKKYMRLGGVA